MKAVTLFIDSILPKDLQDPNRIYDKKGIDALLTEVARRYPKRYSEIVQHIADTGRHAAYHQGETLSMKDLAPVIDKPAVLAKMDQELDIVDALKLNDEEKRQKKIEVWGKYSTLLEKMTQESALASGNALGGIVTSGSRGNPSQLKAMLTTPALYTDYRDRIIPMFIRHGFNEGLRPSEYLASAFGVRKAVISTKRNTADAGDVSKQWAVANAPTIVTEDDCGTNNGLDFDNDDPELEGRVLAKDYGPGLSAGTPIDRHVRQELRKLKGPVIARSPMTCQAKLGICSHCLGLLPEGHFAAKGYAAGMTAANALGEPLAQSSLSSKHTSGMSKGKKQEFSGFSVIDQLAQAPETFPNKATIAEEAGRIGKIEDAPQGGKYIFINNKPHYVLPNFELNVKPGDEVEAGDQLSDGIVNVHDVLRTRGLGEARRYYVQRMGQAFHESGVGRPSKLNLELVARGTLDHLNIDDAEGMGDYLPDDTASYSKLSAHYSPPKDTKILPVAGAVGHYLQAPALHYTIGTQLTPKMVAHMSKAGIPAISVSKQAPGFTPTMVRLRAASHDNPDWIARLNTSYLTANLGEAASRGRESNIEENVNFAPRLMVGEGFGKKIEQTGKF